MEAAQRSDRTWLCSVFFIDVVGYSVQPVALQAAWKGRLNGYLGVAIQDVPEADRVILDTGDGAAICFLGDPEAAMFCGLRLLAALLDEEPRHESPMRARMGINLGPVKLVRDINGNLNAIGDGINVGQRVMSFAGDNQILVSRSFYEVVSCLSATYVDLFRFEGTRRDKHVREHTVYELLSPAARQKAPPVAAGPGPAALELDVLERVERCFAPVVGPIAHLLVRQASSRVTTLEALYETLLEHVPGEQDRARLLDAWDAELHRDEAPGPDVEAPVAPRAPTPAPRAPTPLPVWEPAFLARVRDELAVFIGPVARVLVDRAAARARSQQQLYELVAESIESPAERARFLRR